MLARLFSTTKEPADSLGDVARAEQFIRVLPRDDPLAAQIYYTPEDFEVAERVAAVAEVRGVSPMQVALAWVLRQPGVTAPIVGASRVEHLDQALEALSLTLSDEEAARLEEPYRPHRVLGHA